MTMVLIVVVVLAALGAGTWMGPAKMGREFWINDKDTGLYGLVSSIVATQVGGGVVVGIVSSTYSSGTGFGLVALASTASGIMALSYLARRSESIVGTGDVYTLPEMIGARFGTTAMGVAGVVVFFAYIALLSSQYVAMANMLSHLGGFTFWNGLWISVLGATAYCSVSGLRGDTASDGVLFPVMVLGLLVSIAVLGGVVSTLEFGTIPDRVWSPLTFGGGVYLVGGTLLGAIVPLVSSEYWIRVFSGVDGSTVRKSLKISAALMVPFYLTPIGIGLAGAGLLPHQEAGAIFPLFMERFAHPVLSSIAIAAVVAAILSTSNTYTIVASGALFRNVIPSARLGDTTQRILLFVLGLLGLSTAYVAPDIVDLLLAAFYMLGSMFPSILAALFGWSVGSRAVVASITSGAVVALASYVLIGPQAFVPTIIVATAVLFLYPGRR